jgi:hypothetical protein
MPKITGTCPRRKEPMSKTDTGAGRDSVDRLVRRLGKLQRWWLRQFGDKGSLCVNIDGYAGTPYGKALVGLIDSEIIEPHPTHAAMGVVRLTAVGKRVWNNICDHAEIESAHILSNAQSHQQKESE